MAIAQSPGPRKATTALMTKGSARANAPRPLASPATKWVLIVDDDEHILKSLELLMEVVGNGSKPRVRLAQSGDEAMDLLEAQSFDLIISDYHMGAMDGVEFLSRAQQLEPDVPCVLLSADPGVAEARLRSSPVRNAAFLPKPFEPALLVALVMGALGWSDVHT